MGRTALESTLKLSTRTEGSPVRVMKVSPEMPTQSPRSSSFQRAQLSSVQLFLVSMH